VNGQGLFTNHLIAIPGLGTLTARGLTGSDLQDLGRKADSWLEMLDWCLDLGDSIEETYGL
jgi:hypothetical protein